MKANHKYQLSLLGTPSQQILHQQLHQGQHHQQQQQQQPQQDYQSHPQQQQQPPQAQQQTTLGQYQAQNALHSQLPRLNQPKFMNQQGVILQQPSLTLHLGAGSFPSPNKVNSVNVDDPSSLYWQHQVLLCLLSRAEDLPHYYARQYAQNSRKTKNPYADVKSVTLVDATKTIVATMEEQEKQQAAQTYATPSALMRNKKVDLEEDEEQRMIARTQGKQLWCHMDFSGQGLLNLAPKLFQYEFLESLYLNNNKLTTVPLVVKKLRGLRVLDLSQNRISEIPPELGLCYNLRYLYLFDNNIKTLPHQFRNLIELLFLGIEGNPIDLNIANLIAEQGTKALITHYRDMEPTYPEPKPRSWILLEDDGDVIDPVQNPNAYTDDHLSADSADSFTLMSYNTLCQHYATTKMYKYTPSWALDWDFRRNALKEEIIRYNSDVICLQEVETRTFHDFWVPIMSNIGYKGYFFSKTRSKTMSELESKKVDGCATFYRASKFQLIQKQHLEYNTVCMGSDRYKKTKDLFNRFMNKDHIALITYLQHLESGEKIVVVNTHLHWDPAFNDVKALQVGILLEELQGIVKKFKGTNNSDEAKRTSMVICGDFNSTKKSAVYQLISSGSVSKHEDMDGRDYGRFTDEGFHHSFKLKSAYDHLGSDFPFSNFTPTFTNEIDYVWYSTNSLQVKGLLGKADEEYFAQQIGIPNAHFPSDHIPLVTKFQIKKKGHGAGGTKKPEFKPDYKSASSRKT
ncbi:hypothetical protein METBIDRAFT_34553 [Metschnikowia bicuspidata var. bicuspidata NRRL YB-4993]|uniref:CCR4-Not complex 3'-5'-exoribonuclease subunit Ccr4 n=1 Tax=Metschnikowia bicuspidata var. bicuspidata NRRL YB-4993 TaxID=869754 RepID=A0A1A0HFX6_9ASCO|nr:hypothetical protein METBIDRAFT_34553 [Metschnikowia bicuspidata var. bicuspidata NRRL YB-4993]OBA22758.1 hypothetical protein METBIDRAFT_34553 [Metschnikowia bicuspidata var. bicuspidata NRRL YB-4993]